MKFPIKGTSHLFYAFGSEDSKYLGPIQETDKPQPIDKSTEIKVLFPSIDLFTLLIEMKKIATHVSGKIDFFPYLASASEASDLVLLDCNVHLKDSNGIVHGFVHFNGSVFSPDLPQKPARNFDINYLPTTPRRQGNKGSKSHSMFCLPSTTREQKNQKIRLSDYQKNYPHSHMYPQRYPIYDKSSIKMRSIPNTLYPANLMRSVPTSGTSFGYRKNVPVVQVNPLGKVVPLQTTIQSAKKEETKKEENVEKEEEKIDKIEENIEKEEKIEENIEKEEEKIEENIEKEEEKIDKIEENIEKEEEKIEESVEKMEENLDKIEENIEKMEEIVEKMEGVIEGDEPPGVEQIRAEIENQESKNVEEKLENENKAYEEEEKGEINIEEGEREFKSNEEEEEQQLNEVQEILEAVIEEREELEKALEVEQVVIEKIIEEEQEELKSVLLAEQSVIEKVIEKEQIELDKLNEEEQNQESKSVEEEPNVTLFNILENLNTKEDGPVEVLLVADDGRQEIVFSATAPIIDEDLANEEEQRNEIIIIEGNPPRIVDDDLSDEPPNDGVVLFKEDEIINEPEVIDSISNEPLLKEGSSFLSDLEIKQQSKASEREISIVDEEQDEKDQVFEQLVGQIVDEINTIQEEQNQEQEKHDEEEQGKFVWPDSEKDEDLDDYNPKEGSAQNENKENYEQLNDTAGDIVSFQNEEDQEDNIPPDDQNEVIIYVPDDENQEDNIPPDDQNEVTIYVPDDENQEDNIPPDDQNEIMIYIPDDENQADNIPPYGQDGVMISVPDDQDEPNRYVPVNQENEQSDEQENLGPPVDFVQGDEPDPDQVQPDEVQDDEPNVEAFLEGGESQINELEDRLENETENTNNLSEQDDGIRHRANKVYSEDSSSVGFTHDGSNAKSIAKGFSSDEDFGSGF